MQLPLTQNHVERKTDRNSRGGSEQQADPTMPDRMFFCVVNDPDHQRDPAQDDVRGVSGSVSADEPGHERTDHITFTRSAGTTTNAKMSPNTAATISIAISKPR